MLQLSARVLGLFLLAMAVETVWGLDGRLRSGVGLREAAASTAKHESHGVDSPKAVTNGRDVCEEINKNIKVTATIFGETVKMRQKRCLVHGKECTYIDDEERCVRKGGESSNYRPPTAADKDDDAARKMDIAQGAEDRNNADRKRKRAQIEHLKADTYEQRQLDLEDDALSCGAGGVGPCVNDCLMHYVDGLQYNKEELEDPDFKLKFQKDLDDIAELCDKSKTRHIPTREREDNAKRQEMEAALGYPITKVESDEEPKPNPHWREYSQANTILAQPPPIMPPTPSNPGVPVITRAKVAPSH